MNTGTQLSDYLKRATVLYVEDDDETREQFSSFLRRIVGSLLVARDGEEGLEVYRAHHPHIIITDIQMPNRDGLSMAGEIRSQDRTTRIIVLTAFEQVDYLKASINMGIDKYVTKPIDGMSLHDALMECAQTLLAEEDLQKAASTDPLTGLANRGRLIHQFQAEKNLSERHGTGFSLIIADIDHFKRVNDTYGHNAGDLMLKGVANTLLSSVRLEDTCGRWGGEEYLLILPRTSIDAAAIVAEKLRQAVSAMETEWDGEKISVTISLGVGQFKPGQDLEACVEQVDKALYRAKESGRNRFVIAE
jgi:diguanylate cyclase (GGDEF)-like protein